MPPLDLDWLDDFIEVARQRNFTKAAQVRGLTQSTLSRRIQSLEASLGGVELLDRDKNLELTDAGQSFHQTANDILLKLRESKSDLDKKRNVGATPIYTVHSLSATFVPRVIRMWRERLEHEDYLLNISVVVGTISECTEALAYGAAPLLISFEKEKYRLLFSQTATPFSNERSDIQEESIRSIRIAKDQLIPVCARHNYEQYEAMWKAEVPIPYAAYSDGTYLSELVNEKKTELSLGKRLHRIGDAQMADTLRNMVREGDGVAWVLRSTAQRALHNREIVHFDFGKGPEVNIDLDIKLFRRSEYMPDPPLENIWRASKDLELQFAREEASPRT